MSSKRILIVLALVSAAYAVSTVSRAERDAAQPLPGTGAAAQPAHEGLSIETRHRLNKAHGILMVFAWLFFIPSAFLFARLLRDGWRGKKPMGLAVWFHVHRTSNIIGVVLMIASFVCIMISKGWNWTGPGSSSKYYTKVHTLTGLIALILAWAQPFISIIRCGPSHSLRPLFNWSHRVIGIVSFVLASTALVIAALEFKKIWSDPVLQTLLVLTPAVLMIAATMISLMGGKNEDGERSEASYSLRISFCFWSAGILFTASVVLTFLIAQGYKPVQAH